MPQDAARIDPPNAIGYAQYLIGGGRRMALITTVATAALIGVILATVIGSAFNKQSQRTEGWQICTGLMLGGQALLAFIAGTAAVNTAVRRDLNGGMIESHRLTPDRPLAAAAGYVFGAQSIVVGPMLVLFLAGFYVSQQAGWMPATWLWWHASIAGAAALMWTTVALLAFGLNQAGTWPLVLIVGSITARGWVYVPGLLALVAPILSIDRAATADLTAAGTIGLAGAAVIGGVFFVAVGRMYRSNVADAFDVPLATILLAAWVGLSVVGLLAAELIDPRGVVRDLSPGARTAIGWASCVLVACLPTAAAVRIAVRPATTYALGTRPSHPAMYALLVPLYAAAAWLPFELARHFYVFDPAPEATVAVLAMALIFLTGVALVFAVATLRRSGGWALLVQWLLLSNAPPLIACAVLNGIDEDRLYAKQALFWQTASPFGAIAALSDASAKVPWPSIGVQAALTLIPLALFARVRSREPRRAQSAP